MMNTTSLLTSSIALRTERSSVQSCPTPMDVDETTPESKPIVSVTTLPLGSLSRAFAQVKTAGAEQRRFHLNHLKGDQYPTNNIWQRNATSLWGILIGICQDNGVESLLIDQAMRDINEWGISADQWHQLQGLLRACRKCHQNPPKTQELAWRSQRYSPAESNTALTPNQFIFRCVAAVMGAVAKIETRRYSEGFARAVRGHEAQIRKFNEFIQSHVDSPGLGGPKCQRTLRWDHEAQPLPVEETIDYRARALNKLTESLVRELMLIDELSFERRLPLVKLFAFLGANAPK